MLCSLPEKQAFSDAYLEEEIRSSDQVCLDEEGQGPECQLDWLPL